MIKPIKFITITSSYNLREVVPVLYLTRKFAKNTKVKRGVVCLSAATDPLHGRVACLTRWERL